jgi:type IX secretion system PorP/SprF family membrane protein
MKNYILHTAFFVLLAIGAHAQHTPLISQYMQNALPLNPAFSGSRDALSLAGSFRSQWAGFEGAPVTQTISAHTPLKNESFAVGMMIFNDKIGVTRETGAYANFAYRLKLRKGKLSFGLAAGASQRASNWTDINTDEGQDEAFMQDRQTAFLPNFSFGAYYYNSDWYASLSIPMMLTHSFEGKGYVASNKFENYNVMLNGGMEYSIDRYWDLRPSVMLRYLHSSPLQADINIMARYDEFVEGGLSFRTDKSLIVLGRYFVNEQFAVGYSFGWIFQKIGQYQNGTHEITLTYDFKYVSHAANPKFF